jgi:hypothetical protein
MPVAFIETKERPAEKRRIDMTNIRVFDNIPRIIPLNESIPKTRKIDQERRQGGGSREIVFITQGSLQLQPPESQEIDEIFYLEFSYAAPDYGNSAGVDSPENCPSMH